MKDSTLEKFDGIKENRETPPPAYFNVLFYGLIIWGIIFCAYFLFSGWTSHSEFQANMQEFQAKHQTSAGAQQNP